MNENKKGPKKLNKDIVTVSQCCVYLLFVVVNKLKAKKNINAKDEIRKYY